MYYIIVKVYITLSVPLSDNERKNNKNVRIATKTICKSIHKTLFHKLKPFIGACYTLHTRMAIKSKKKYLKNTESSYCKKALITT